jgi:hypothetical protein
VKDKSYKFYKLLLLLALALALTIVKVNAIPSQALTSLEGSRRLRFPDFKTIGT